MWGFGENQFFFFYFGEVFGFWELGEVKSKKEKENKEKKRLRDIKG